jgi:hypothetical protein
MWRKQEQVRTRERRKKERKRKKIRKGISGRTKHHHLKEKVKIITSISILG